MTKKEKVIAKRKHGKLFNLALFLGIISFVTVEYVPKEKLLTNKNMLVYKDSWKINLINPISLFALFIYFWILMIFYIICYSIPGISKAIQQFNKVLKVHETYFTGTYKKSKKVVSPDKLQTLLDTLNSGYIKAVEKYLSRVYNIKREGNRYIQKYFMMENDVLWNQNEWIIPSHWHLDRDIEKNKIVYEVKETLELIINEIMYNNADNHIQKVIKISIPEVVKKFKLDKQNPGLIKIVKNKQTDKGFKTKYFIK